MTTTERNFTVARRKPPTLEQLAMQGRWDEVSAQLSEVTGTEVAAYPVAELVGITEAAVLLESTRPTVAMWAKRRLTNGFPAPVIHKSIGSLFWRPEVQAWTGPPGRWNRQPADVA